MLKNKNSETEDNIDLDLPKLDLFFDFPTDKTDAVKTDDARLLDEISEISKQGYAFLKEGDTKNASIEFMRVLELDENNNYAIVGLGDIARKTRNFDKAIYYYEECLKFHPNNNYALFGLAECYKSQCKYEKAVELWERTLKLDKTNIVVLTRIADAYRKNSNFDKAKSTYQKVLDLDASNSYALIGLGHLHYDFKKYREALLYWKRILELSLDGADIRILTSVGNCYRKLKEFDKALPFFVAATEKEEKNFYALFGLADCYRGLGRHDKSLICWKAILEFDPCNKVILTRLGDAYRNIGEFDNAEATYKKALAIAYDSYASLGLAILKMERGLYDEALESFNELLKKDKKNYRIYFELAKCYLILEETEKALSVLDNFQQLGIRNTYITDLYNQIKNRNEV